MVPSDCEYSLRNARILPSLRLPTHPYTSLPVQLERQEPWLPTMCWVNHLDSFMCDSCHESAHHTLGGGFGGVSHSPAHQGPPPKIRLGAEGWSEWEKPSVRGSQPRQGCWYYFQLEPRVQKRKSQEEVLRNLIRTRPNQHTNCFQAAVSKGSRSSFPQLDWKLPPLRQLLLESCIPWTQLFIIESLKVNLKHNATILNSYEWNPWGLLKKISFQDLTGE